MKWDQVRQVGHGISTALEKGPSTLTVIDKNFAIYSRKLWQFSEEKGLIRVEYSKRVLANHIMVYQQNVQISVTFVEGPFSYFWYVCKNLDMYVKMVL